MKNIVFIYTEKFMQVFVGFLISYLVVNYFNPNDYGVYKYVMSLSLVFLVFVMLGFNVTNIRYIPEHLVNKSYYKIGYQICIFSVFQCVMMLFLFVVFYFAIKLNLVLLDKNVSILHLFLFFIFFYVKSYFGESLLTAFSRRVILSTSRIFLYLIQLSIIYYAISFEVDIGQFILCVIFFSFVEAVFLSIAAYCVYRSAVEKFAIKAFDVKLYYGYAANNYGFTISNFLKDNAATIIAVSYLFGYTEVAYYSVALLIPNIVRAFSPSKVFSGLILPDFVRSYHSNKDKNVIFSGLNFVAKLNLIFLLPALIYSIIMYPFIIELFFGVEYSRHSYVLAVFLFVNVVFLSYLDLNLIAANVLERSDLVFKINLLSISNIFLLILLVEFGTNAIGISNLVSTMLTVFIFWWKFKSIFRNKIAFYFTNMSILLYVSFLAVVAFFLYSISMDAFMMLFPFIALGATYKIVDSHFFTDEEHQIISSKFPTIFKPKVSQ